MGRKKRTANEKARRRARRRKKPGIVLRILRKLDSYLPYPVIYPFRMSANEKGLFDRAIADSQHYLEFGFGGSTLRAIQKSKAKIYTVESSPEWIASMREYLAIRTAEDRRLFIYPMDIGPTNRWAHPVSDECTDGFESYSSDIHGLIDSSLIDLALIDGRFRVACTLKVIMECHGNDGLRILIHDFWKREYYHILLKYLNVLEKADTMGLFSIRDDVDLSLVERDYQTYKLQSE